LGVGAGMALALRQKKLPARVIVLHGDGELSEGAVWEAVMFAGKLKINNLTMLMDRNNIQIDGFTEDVMPLEPLREKYESFNWRVMEINGHSIEEIVDSVNEAKTIYEKPTLIIAHTIPGKGVSFMENDYAWHGKPPTKDQALAALKELRSLGGKIEME